MKNSLITFLFLLSFEGYSHGILKNVEDSLRIIKFETHIGHVGRDSVWNISKSIRLSSQPTLLTISLKDITPNLDLICIIKEPSKVNDTLHLGSNSTVSLFNLTGGDYTATFINLKNQHRAVINFSIAPVFWERWWFSPFVFLIISLVLGAIFYAIYLVQLSSKLRLQSVRHELEIKALRAQMNPHFIFNCMNTIDAYILRKRFIEASDCLQKFSKLIRQILENSENQTIGISQELETLKLYIELEQERFSDSFSYAFDIQPQLLDKDYQLPPLLLQPFVENAILHGIRHLTDRKGKILVKLNIISEQVLGCLIEDNGVGRSASSEINRERQTNHKSMGMNVTMERIRTYQAIYGDTMQTIITDLAEGTKVEIKLPLIRA